MEQLVVSGVTYNRNEARSACAASATCGVAARCFAVAADGVVVDMIIQNCRRTARPTHVHRPRDAYARSLEVAKKTAARSARSRSTAIRDRKV